MCQKQSQELTRANPHRNIFSIKCDHLLFFLYRGLVHLHHRILNEYLQFFHKLICCLGTYFSKETIDEINGIIHFLLIIFILNSLFSINLLADFVKFLKMSFLQWNLIKSRSVSKIHLKRVFANNGRRYFV